MMTSPPPRIPRLFCIVTYVLLVALLQAEGGLTLNKKCGEKYCADKEFCSPFDNICRPCESVCELGSHNYQEELCQKDCQDYLHDRLYVKRSEQPIEHLQDELERLYHLVLIVLILSSLILVILTAMLTYAYLRAKKKNGGLALKIRKKIAAINAISSKENNNKEADAEAPRCVYTVAPAPPRPARLPAEDTTLEYGSYDNPALTPSPLFDKGVPLPKRESSF